MALEAVRDDGAHATTGEQLGQALIHFHRDELAVRQMGARPGLQHAAAIDGNARRVRIAEQARPAARHRAGHVADHRARGLPGDASHSDVELPVLELSLQAGPTKAHPLELEPQVPRQRLRELGVETLRFARGVAARKRRVIEARADPQTRANRLRALARDGRDCSAVRASGCVRSNLRWWRRRLTAAQPSGNDPTRELAQYRRSHPALHGENCGPRQLPGARAK
jgi:hypothetical protein